MQTVTTSLIDRLRKDILNGSLKPGTKLVVQRLQERYDAGQNPLREALSRLAPEGLVVSEDQKGFAVAPISREDLEELTDLRELLECTALERSIERGDAEWEARVIAANHLLRSMNVRSELTPTR